MLEITRKGTGEAAQRLRTEAAVLAATDMAGLPMLVSFEEHDGEWELATSVPPGVPLRDKAPLPASEAAGIVLALAVIARELADGGIRREPFRAEQIHLAGGARPMLRHLAGAEQGQAGESIEPGAGDLGRLLHIMLPPPVRRRLWAIRDDPATALRRVAHRAADPAMGLASFTTLVREAAPDARLPRLASSRQPAPHRTKRSIVLAVASAVALAAATASGVVLTAGDRDRGTPSAGPVGHPPESTAAAAENEDEDGAGQEAQAVWPRYGCPPPEATAIDVDGEPCPVAAAAAGTTITAGTRAWQVRGAGSYVTALGDWDCTGRITVAALDVDNGDIWVFSTFAAPGTPATATYVGRASGAVTIASTDGCGAMSALDGDGREVEVVESDEGVPDPDRQEPQP